MVKHSDQKGGSCRFTDWAMEIESIARAGLSYSDSPYEIERCLRLQQIADEMLAWQSDQTPAAIHRLFAVEEGYITPKVDTRAAVFEQNRILLVHEKNGTWALPGGWCESTLSPGENAVKETEEEAGYRCRPVRLLAVHDWRKHNPCNLPYGVIKLFIECEILSKTQSDGLETSEARFFALDDLPDPLAEEKNTREQIALCFLAHQSGPDWTVPFD